MAVAQAWRNSFFSAWPWLELGAFLPFEGGCGTSLAQMCLCKVRVNICISCAASVLCVKGKNGCRYKGNHHVRFKLDNSKCPGQFFIHLTSAVTKDQVAINGVGKPNVPQCTP